MDLGLSIAASGMLAEQVRQDQLSNDLANSSTPGFKQDNSVQQSSGSLLLSNVATGQQVGAVQTGVRISKTVTDMSQGPIQQTGQPLDFAITRTGLFAVRATCRTTPRRSGS
jgi:flagellar basal-body rod protein FlgF